MSANYANAGQQRVDALMVPGVPTTFALIASSGTWDSAPRVLIGPVGTDGDIDLVVPEVATTVTGDTAVGVVDETDMAAILTAYPVAARTALPWHVRLGTGETEAAVSTGFLLWDTTGRATGEVAATLVVGPAGPSGAGDATLNDLTDVSTAGQAAGKALVSDGTNWAPSAAAAVLTTDARLSDARTPTTHAASHATGQADAISPASIGAQPAGSYAPALGADDNYVTAAEKVKLANLSGTNTGDQTLPTWTTISGKPAVVADGATAADARTAIGAGTSSFDGAYASLSGKPTLGDAAAKNTGTIAGTVAAGDHTHTGVYAAASHAHAASDVSSGTLDAARLPAATETAIGAVELATTTEATTGTDTTRAVTPAGVKAVADTKAAASHTHAATDLASGTVATARLGSGTADSTTMLGGDQAYRSPHAVAQSINAQTGTTYTLVAGDAGKLVTCTNAAAITVTLPQDSDATLPIGTRVDVAVLGAGMVTFTAGTGATANGTPSLVTRAQYSAATCIKRAANTWLVVGDLA